ncbi:hypothetical protein SFRURICE_014431, partial [Spodoptera frugiperda]
MDENEFFRQTVQHLARCLSSINPTPWEKVNTLFMLCPQVSSSLIVTPRSQEASIALGLYFLQSNLQHQDKLLPYFLKVLKCLTTAQFEEPVYRIKNGDREYHISLFVFLFQAVCVMCMIINVREFK